MRVAIFSMSEWSSLEGQVVPLHFSRRWLKVRHTIPGTRRPLRSFRHHSYGVSKQKRHQNIYSKQTTNVFSLLVIKFVLSRNDVIIGMK